MELIYIRHTAVGVPPGTCYGISDIPLAETFPQDLESVRGKLVDPLPARWYSSPSSRCRLLAEALAPGDIEIDDRLTEMNFGEWESLPWKELPRDQVTRWSQNLEGPAAPRGETGQQLIDRNVAFFEALKASDEDAVVVTHSGCVHAVMCHVLGFNLAASYRIDIDFGSITRILIQGKSIRFTAINA
ncbi:MAG: alpha-ribazole phosphatase family protein [Acidobacteriota bacterium]|nr:alpha-ribazole phosphatase family protein [Acidobacteriota bacterium]